MARKEGLIGRKVGMTQVFGDDGSHLPVTVIQAGPCTITAVRTKATDGYDALQLGFEAKKKNVTKPMQGHFKKLGVGALGVLRELRLDRAAAEKLGDYTVGQHIGVDIFAPGEIVDVVGVTKGKGFQGGVKRHNWKGGEATHGSMFHRAPGSIGGSSNPSRVFPGMRAAGRMGGKRITTKNVRVVKVDEEKNLIFLFGAVPGPRGGYVTIRRAKKG